MSMCPFCGSAKLKFFARIAGGYERHYIGQVHCMSCGARGPAVNSKKMDYRDHLSPASEALLREQAFARFDRNHQEPQGGDDLPLFAGCEK